MQSTLSYYIEVAQYNISSWIKVTFGLIDVEHLTFWYIYFIVFTLLLCTYNAMDIFWTATTANDNNGIMLYAEIYAETVMLFTFNCLPKVN